MAYTAVAPHICKSLYLQGTDYNPADVVTGEGFGPPTPVASGGHGGPYPAPVNGAVTQLRAISSMDGEYFVNVTRVPAEVTSINATGLTGPYPVAQPSYTSRLNYTRGWLDYAFS